MTKAKTKKIVEEKTTIVEMVTVEWTAEEALKISKVTTALTHVTQMWPTPVQADSDRTSETYPRGNKTLLGAAMWPTPDANTSTYSNGFMGPNIREAAANWPTPTARDIRPGDGEGRQGGKSLVVTVGLQAQTTPSDGHDCSPKCRRLNPRFVEWLMGFPIGHTDLKPLETQ